MIDLEFADLPLPSFLKSRLERHIAKGDIPSMIFDGPTLEAYTAAVLLGKAIDAEILYVDIEKEGASAKHPKGLRSLRALETLLGSRTVEGKRRLLLLDSDLARIPKSYSNDLRDLILSAESRVIFVEMPWKHNKVMKSAFPVIDFNFRLDHSPSEYEYIITQFKKLFMKLGEDKSDDEVAALAREHYPRWSSLLKEKINLPEVNSITLIQKKPRRIRTESDPSPSYFSDIAHEPTFIRLVMPSEKGGAVDL